MEKLDILYEDSLILVCEKPKGVPVQSDKSFDFDLVNMLKNYIFENSDKKSPPYLGLIHRLDRPVGGVMVFAKTPFAAKELSHQIQQGSIIKKYLAVIEEKLLGEYNKKIRLEDFLLKNGKTNTSEVVDKKVNGAKKSILEYSILERSEEGITLVEVILHTGRHHQIRVQMANINAPLFGDTKYNKKHNIDITSKNWMDIGLYSYQLGFKHPKTKENMIFTKVPEFEPFNKFEYVNNNA